MFFQESPLAGAFIITPNPINDERGLFARTFCQKEFGARGLNTKFVQQSTSFNLKMNTVRGLHFQKPPCGEIKLIRCTRGRLHDVIVDLRQSSPTYLSHFSIELSATNRLMLYIPQGFAHGFQTLEDATEVFYQMSEFFNAEAADGVRWNDPRLKLSWPLDNPIISAKDLSYPSI